MMRQVQRRRNPTCVRRKTRNDSSNRLEQFVRARRRTRTYRVSCSRIELRTSFWRRHLCDATALRSRSMVCSRPENDHSISRTSEANSILQKLVACRDHLVATNTEIEHFRWSVQQQQTLVGNSAVARERFIARSFREFGPITFPSLKLVEPFSCSTELC